LAVSKQHKGELLSTYEGWLHKSQAVFVLEYSKMRVKDIDNLRNKLRDVGGEVHVVKNTLMLKAMAEAGIQVKGTLEGSLLFGFALKDAPAMAKVLADATKNSEMFKLRGGYLDKRPMTTEGVKSLADLPPLPVMRARLLGALLAPATQLARTLAEPARQVAYVIKAYSEPKEQEAAPAAA
jgi:large subunit ribosomal protein L10